MSQVSAAGAGRAAAALLLACAAVSGCVPLLLIPVANMAADGLATGLESLQSDVSDEPGNPPVIPEVSPGDAAVGKPELGAEAQFIYNVGTRAMYE